MATNLTVNGSVYSYPDNDDTQWGTVATAWAAAVSNSTLQKTGGNFTLTADANFGPNYGLVTEYVKSNSANVASTGEVRLANTDKIAFRNSTNDGDVTIEMDGDNLTFGGTGIGAGTITTDTLIATHIEADYYKSKNGGSAQSGLFRLNNVEGVVWRNSTDTGDVALSLDGNDLAFYGNKLTSTGITTTGSVTAGATGLVINGGTPLTTTNRTGTGNLVLATSPTISAPVINGGTVSGSTLVNPTNTLNLPGGGYFYHYVSTDLNQPIISGGEVGPRYLASTTVGGIMKTLGQSTFGFETSGGTGSASFDVKNLLSNDTNRTGTSFSVYHDETGNPANYLAVKSALTGSAPQLLAKGSDTDVDIKLTAKGSGRLVIDGGPADQVYMDASYGTGSYHGVAMRNFSGDIVGRFGTAFNDNTVPYGSNNVAFEVRDLYSGGTAWGSSAFPDNVEFAVYSTASGGQTTAAHVAIGSSIDPANPGGTGGPTIKAVCGTLGTYTTNLNIETQGGGSLVLKTPRMTFKGSNVNIAPANNTGGAGYSLAIDAGTGVGAGGVATFGGGAAGLAGSAGGAVLIGGGSGSGSGAGGNATVLGGTSNSGTGGQARIIGGTSISSAGGDVHIRGGGGGAGGAVIIETASNELPAIKVSGTATPAIGFNGSSPITKPTITGTRADGVATASLLTALANYGLVVDSTSAGTAGAAAPAPNYIINGSMRVAQRAALTIPTSAPAVGTGYGKVDRFYSYAGASLTAGTATQTTASPVGTSGYAHHASGVSCSAGGLALFLGTRIEAKTAVAMKNQTVTVSAKVQHDAGVNATYTIYLHKANSADTFSAVTLIGNSSGTVVATGTPATISYTVAAGDCSNGLQVLIGVTTAGAITTKNFYTTEMKLEVGSSATEFQYPRFEEELSQCLRFYEKSFAYGTDPQEGASWNNNYGMTMMATMFTTTFEGQAVQFKAIKRANPTLTAYRTSNNATNGRWAYAWSGSYSETTNTPSFLSGTTGFSYNVGGANLTTYQTTELLGYWTASSEL